jgi:hypothetical protein
MLARESLVDGEGELTIDSRAVVLLTCHLRDSSFLRYCLINDSLTVNTVLQC